MPTFGRKPSSIEETMAGLEGVLTEFHAASGGDLEDIASLFKAMSGQALPPPVLCQLMGVSEEQMRGASRENPIKVSAAQLLGGIQAALDENDTAAMYTDKIAACTAAVTERREIAQLRAAITLDESTALDIEARLWKSMKDDAELQSHLAGLKELHEKWRENTDVADAARFPTIVVGPQILSFDPMSAVHHGMILNETEREKFFLRPGENGVGLLREKLAALRRSSVAVAAAQRERIAWLAAQATGLTLAADVLGNGELVGALDSTLAAEITSEGFQKTVDDLLGDVTLGPSSVRIDAVEAEISKAMGRAGEALPVPIKGYDVVVLHACLRAIAEETFASDAKASPIAASLTAVKKTRRKIGDRFFRKKWLPLESNPEVFNELGRQLGLPTDKASFYEVFGLDPDLLAMVPSPAYAVLVCFPLTAEYRKAAGEAETADAARGPYFLHQSVPNACGTVALVHAFANMPEGEKGAADGAPSQWLHDFVAKTKELDAMGRAAALESDEALAASHNSAAQQGDTNVESFQAPSASANAFQAVLHFVCYVHHDGNLYELDGLKKGPVNRGSTTPERLLADSAECVKTLLAGDADELRVNLMALAKAS